MVSGGAVRCAMILGLTPSNYSLTFPSDNVRRNLMTIGMLEKGEAAFPLISYLRRSFSTSRNRLISINDSGSMGSFALPSSRRISKNDCTAPFVM